MRVPAGLVALTLCGCGSEVDLSDARFPIPQIPWNPSTYVAHRTVDTVTVDGVLDELSWQRAEWTEAFTDIRGPSLPEPRFATRVKMLWDDDYFFVAADLEESHVWARLRQRDAVIYRDNDFEVFIDPDGDTHEYYELEINAFGTEWDLFLVRPYRDGGPALHA
ncbi:MAG: carbohydrate-binding family 9-like protein, partial [Gemmatimonadales bacterium]